MTAPELRDAEQVSHQQDSRRPLPGSVAPLERGFPQETSIQLSGDLDAFTIGATKASLWDVADVRSGPIALDLSMVTFADSSALGLLVDFHQRAIEEGRRMRVSAASAPVRAVLELAGMWSVLTGEAVLRRGAASATVEESPPLRFGRPFSHEFVFGRRMTAPSVARAVVARWLTPDLERCDDVLLVVSELVTNVLLHTASGGRLLVECGPTVELEIHDASGVIPMQRDSAGSAGGFGLRLVERLALAWGCELTAGGKVIWVRLPGRVAG